MAASIFTKFTDKKVDKDNSEAKKTDDPIQKPAKEFEDALERPGKMDEKAIFGVIDKLIEGIK